MITELHPLIKKARKIENHDICSGTETHTDVKSETTDHREEHFIKYGTETMTEAVEDTDKDSNLVLFGTETHTNTIKEATDSDYSRII